MQIVANKNITISISMKSSDIARVEKIRAAIKKKEGSLLSYSALIRRALFAFAEAIK